MKLVFKMKKIKVAIVHEWFIDYSGSERVVEKMIDCFPDADLFSLVDFLPMNKRGFIKNKSVTTSFIQKLPFSRKKFRSYLPLFPLAVEQFNLTAYELIISSSHSVAKGVITGPNQLHICMCYSPIRYAWDLQHQYLNESGLQDSVRGWIIKWALHKIRIWDVRTANGVDSFIAISKFISSRIYKTYRRASTVIYPPVDTENFSFHKLKEDFYFTSSRMAPYKRLPMIVEAFSRMSDKKLIVIGDGPDFEKCKSLAGKNITLMGWQPFSILKDNMQKAKAFIFAAEEDFGISPLEAQACGTPVIAYAKGAALETIRGLDAINPTGVFFRDQTIDGIIAAVTEFELNNSKISPESCRENALRFSPEVFEHNFYNFVENEIIKFQSN